jgi:hypothetical protein
MNQSVVFSIVGTIAVVVSFIRAQPLGSSFPPRDAVGRMRFLHTARSVTATSWPLVMSSFAQGANVACVWPSVVWMLVVWWLDVRRLTHPDTSTTESSNMLRRGVRMEPTMVTALTFGLCGLVGARSDTRYTKYIVYALVACILVVLPHVEMSVEDPMSPLISEVQRAVLIHGIATVVTCVCLTRTSTIPVPT